MQLGDLIYPKMEGVGTSGTPKLVDKSNVGYKFLWILEIHTIRLETIEIHQL